MEMLNVELSYREINGTVIEHVQYGNVRVRIWLGKSNNKERYFLSLERLNKPTNTWHPVGSIGAEEAPILCLALQEAYKKIGVNGEAIVH